MSNALIDNLEKYGAKEACNAAKVWMKDRTPAQVWMECERADWLLWWVEQNIGNPGWPTHQELVSITVDCVRHVVDKHYPDQSHPCQIALTTALAWTRGEATVEDCKRAAYAAYAARAAYAAARAAYAAAYAADAAYAAAYAADAAYAAARAAYAAAYAADAAYAAAYAADARMHERMCRIIRVAWPIPKALGEQE